MENVAFVTVTALVNTDDLKQTAKEIHGRVETHETIVDIFTKVSKAPEEVIQKVEAGTWEIGDLSTQICQTTESKDGDLIFTLTTV